jgi:hypothetical protein
MLGPVFAPELLIFGSELAAAFAARAAAKRLAALPKIELPFKAPRGGNTIPAQGGMRAHKDFARGVDAKGRGWRPEQTLITQDGKRVRIDALAPLRAGKGKKGVHLKPDSPSGRRAGEKEVQRYKDELDMRTRTILYDPAKYR